MKKALQKPSACSRIVSDTLENEIDKHIILTKLLKTMEFNNLPSIYTMELNKVLDKQKGLLVKYSTSKEINDILEYKTNIKSGRNF